jgi:hypothetical protein
MSDLQSALESYLAATDDAWRRYVEQAEEERSSKPPIPPTTTSTREH